MVRWAQLQADALFAIMAEQKRRLKTGSEKHFNVLRNEKFTCCVFTHH